MRAMLFSFSALSLLVLRNDADHPNHAATLDDLAFVADLLNRRPDFHVVLSRIPI
jgi:hypothetical protein